MCLVLNLAFCVALLPLTPAFGEAVALMVPATALTSVAGLDFVGVASGQTTVQRAVVPGQHQTIAGVDMVEVRSGLQVGDLVVPKAAHE